MSPAIVDIRDPAAPPQSSRNPQIPVQSNPSSNPDPSVDRGDCALFGAFVRPSPAPSFSASAKPAGLSKPRLAKVRRHLASSRLRQATISDAQPSPASDPFRQGLESGGGLNSNLDAKKVGGVNEGSGYPAAFVFGKDTKGHENQSGNLDSKNVALQETSSVDSGTGVFVFGSGVNGVKKSSVSSRSGFDESSSSKLPDNGKESEQEVRGGNIFVFGSTTSATASIGSEETRKQNLHRAGNDGGFENGKEADRSSKLDGSNVYIFGSSKSVPGSFGGSTGASLPDAILNPRQSSSTGFKGLFATLPEDTSKVNLQSTRSEDGSKNASETNDVSKVDGKNMFVFGSSKSAHSSFGANSTSNPLWNGSGLSESSSVCSSEEGSFSKLPDEMRKLNLQSAGNEDGFLEHGKQGGQSSKVDESGVCIFVSGENTPSLFGSVMLNELIDEMKKRDIGSETASRSTEDAAGAFVFGSNVKSFVSTQTSTASSTSYDKSKPPVIPDALHNLNAGSLVNNESLKKSTEKYMSNGFASGSSGEIGSSLGNGSTATLPDEMRKLHISKKVEHFAGSTDQVFPPSGLATNGSYNSLNFTYQAGERDTNTSTDAVPQSQPQDRCRYAGSTASSSHPSTPGPKIESTAADFTFASMRVKPETPNMEFKTPKQDTPCFRDNSRRTNKKRGKLRRSIPHHQSFAEPFTSKETKPQENPAPKSPAGYSPMDCSPYREILVADPCSRETSVISDERTHHASYGAFINVRKDDPVSVTQCLDTKDGDGKHKDLDDGKAHTERHLTHESSFVNEKVSHISNNENAGFKSDTNTTVKEVETQLFNSNPDTQSSVSRTSFNFSSSFEGFGESSSTFVSSPSVHGRRHYRRKFRVKAGQHLLNSTHDAKVTFVSSPFQVASSSAHHDPVQGLNGISSVPSSGCDSRKKENNKPEFRSQSTLTEALSIAAQEACEKWRLRGNQAYANGLLMKAEDYYTHGMDSVSPKETSRNCMKALMLCYSNRAATRMSLGRMREALSDCLMAAAIDPSFLKAQLRAGNCHLALGESQDAMKHFKKCLQLRDDANIDKKISSEACEGLQKAQKVADYVDQSAELLQHRRFSEARKALDMISETLSISPHFERLMEMKAEALFLLRSYEEVVQLCQQTMDSSERNFVATGCDSSEGMRVSPGRLWRWRLISKSYFYLGKLEEALDFIQKHEEVQPIMDKYRSMTPVPSAPFSITVRELLRLKAAGNEAFQAGQHLEAVEHYTAALTCNTESRPFAAICFCNRAAAYQVLGQVTDAIADCSLAIALDSGYAKAISRRATLHEMIRDYGQATSDLRRLISLLQQQSEAVDNGSDVKQAHLRLSAMEEEVKKDIPLDMYMILGIQQSCSGVDVKKAYRKAALRHHPDKAGQFLARSDVDEGIWKDIANEMHMDADRLFKMIGEAYSILSDPTKRLKYDAEEEMRTALKKGTSGICTPRTPKTASDSYSSPYDKNVNTHQWRVPRDNWKPYGSSQQRWSEYSRSNM